MIEWRKYDKGNDQMIIADEEYLVTDGKRINFFKYTRFGEGYEWTDSVGFPINGVTHWAPINLPGEEEA
ncbi:hypothetical protein MKZ12_07180 [Paenibacillus sp. FSL R5-0713]|uniref:hypothetical protein n=1 Tax=Paenibacillus sp. FSL R5-0713 TaxID=2921655 RepID=UPI0030DBAD72